MIENKFDLTGKMAVVTGGANGLGFCVAKSLYDAGADILIMDNANNIETSAKELNTQNRTVLYVQSDLSDISEIENDYQKVLSKTNGRIDVLFNGAGVQYRSLAENFPQDKWDWVLNINLNAVFRLSQLAGRTMLSKSYGKIINVASMTSFFGSEMVAAYSASKGAIAQLTKALSNEWSSRGVVVNAIAPGYMETKLTDDMKEKNPMQYKEITNRIPMKRWGKPEDLGGLAVFLASDCSAYITGAIIPVDGGYLGK